MNGETRPSRLIRSIPRYIVRSVLTIGRALLVYSPGRTFFWIGSVPLACREAAALFEARSVSILEIAGTGSCVVLDRLSD